MAEIVDLELGDRLGEIEDYIDYDDEETSGDKATRIMIVCSITLALWCVGAYVLPLVDLTLWQLGMVAIKAFNIRGYGILHVPTILYTTWFIFSPMLAWVTMGRIRTAVNKGADTL